jgi:hypothetical protein
MPRLSNNDRNQALGMLRAGISTREVARLFNCHQSTVVRLRLDSSENNTSCHLCLVHCKWVLAHAKRCWWCRGVSSGPLNGRLSRGPFSRSLRAHQDLRIFQQDNARPHTARVSMNFLQAQNVNCMHWPSLSPDMAPIEHVQIPSISKFSTSYVHLLRWYRQHNGDALKE